MLFFFIETYLLCVYVQQACLQFVIAIFSTGSPFAQEIAELTAPSVDGPGLRKGVVAEPCEFTIDARGFPGDITIDIAGNTS